MDENSIVASGGWATPAPMYWDMATTSPNSGITGWNRNVSTGVHVPPAKTSAEFAKINTEVMTKEQVLKQLNNALVALEESEAAWQEEHDARLEAEATVEALREAGFTGGEPVESETEEVDFSEFSDGIVPRISAPRGSSIKVEPIVWGEPEHKLTDMIARKLRNSE